LDLTVTSIDKYGSETPKDPGIPSEFPYKDRILAEVAEQRRLVRGSLDLQKRTYTRSRS